MPTQSPSFPKYQRKDTGMAKTSITEALAEINTIEKRIAKKQRFVHEHLLRQEQLKDPLEKSQGNRRRNPVDRGLAPSES
jgi:hypothetical protein